MKSIVRIILVAIGLLFMSCDKQYEGPRGLVYLDLGTYAMWNTYGVHGVGDSRYFNRVKQIPANFPYSVNTYTGYGGVLLIIGLDNEPLAYDASCPVESDPNIYVIVDPDNLFEAYCPNCKSRYGLDHLGGALKGGVAYENKRKLTLYQATKTDNGGYVITSR